MPDFAEARTIMAATRKILSTTRAILALTWFCHLSMYLWSLGGGGLGSPKGGTRPLFMKKTSMSKNDFLTIWSKKKWIWKMTLADPPPSMEFSIIFFLNPSLKDKCFNWTTICKLGCRSIRKLLHPPTQ